MSHSRVYAFALAVFLAFPLAACSSSDSEETTPGESPVEVPATDDETTPVDAATNEPAPDDAVTANPDDAAASNNGAEDPCLLTGAEISSVLGGSYDDGALNTELSSSPVFYREYFNTDTEAIALAIVLTTPRGFSAAAQRPTYESVRSNVVDVTIPGATDAYSVDASVVLAQVGEYGFTVQNYEKFEDDSDGTTVKLAELTVANFG